MYEHYITATKHNIESIDIDIDEEAYWQDFNPDAGDEPNAEAFLVHFTVAVRTDELATLSIDGEGFVYAAFGGTGTNRHELDELAEHAVRIWRELTDDDETICRYKVRDEDEQNQMSREHLIDA